METPDATETVLDSLVGSVDRFGDNFDRTETAGHPEDEVAVSFGEVRGLFRWGALSPTEESATVSLDANVPTDGVKEAIGEVDDCFARHE